MEEVLCALRPYYPKIQIKNKSSSILMRVISWLMFFNRRFMTDYVTTIGNTIYLPDTHSWPKDAIIATILHEFVHIDDDNKDKLFKIKYLFPQILAPLFLILIPFNYIWALGLFILCLLPWPAPWRKRYEIRAYTMSLVAFYYYFKGTASEDWINRTLEELTEFYNTVFTGAGYWYMWPFGVKKEIAEIIHDIKTGDIFRKDSIYTIGYHVVT